MQKSGLSISVPDLEMREPDEISQAKLDMVAKATMRALLDQPAADWPTPLQWPMVVGDAVPEGWRPVLALNALRDAPGTAFTWSNPVPGHALALYVGSRPVGRLVDGDAPLTVQTAVGDTLVTVLEPEGDGAPVAYDVWAVAEPGEPPAAP